MSAEQKPIKRVMGEACTNCYGSGVGLDGRPCPFAPHKQTTYKIRPTKIEPGSDIHFSMLGAEFGYNTLMGDEYRQMQEYSRKVWQAALATQPQAPQGAVTEGWALKPLEPNIEMLESVGNILDTYPAKLVWMRMFLAAPKTETPEGVKP